MAVQKDPRMPSVLAGHQVHLLEDLQHPQSDVFEIAYRCGTDVKHGRELLSVRTGAGQPAGRSVCQATNPPPTRPALLPSEAVATRT